MRRRKMLEQLLAVSAPMMMSGTRLAASTSRLISAPKVMSGMRLAGSARAITAAAVSTGLLVPIEADANPLILFGAFFALVGLDKGRRDTLTQAGVWVPDNKSGDVYNYHETTADVHRVAPQARGIDRTATGGVVDTSDGRVRLPNTAVALSTADLNQWEASLFGKYSQFQGKIVTPAGPRREAGPAIKAAIADAFNRMGVPIGREDVASFRAWKVDQSRVIGALTRPQDNGVTYGAIFQDGTMAPLRAAG